MNAYSSVVDRRQLIALLGAFGVAGDALAQDAVRADPRAFAVLFENDRVRVLEYTSTPGMGICGQGVHSHPPHVNVAMTAMKGRITLADGKTIVAECKAGDVSWEGAVTHATENIGGSGARAYMIELKELAAKPHST